LDAQIDYREKMTESELQGMKKALVNSTPFRVSFLGLLPFISYFVFPAIV
jgi:hypothetical protein